MEIWETFFPILSVPWEILKAWWWVPLPFLLIQPFLYFWFWWKRTAWYKKVEWVLLEIKVPTEQAKTPKAMELVLVSLAALYSGLNTREIWIDGEFDLWLSLEIVGIDGIPHFFIRCPKNERNFVESNIYSQYPDAEIFEAKDYTKNIPQDIPNGDWDFWGRSMILKKDAPYPIKTYKEFGAPEEKEEKIVDPVANLLEGMAKLKKGEQMWIQILIRPQLGGELKLKEKGKKLRDKLAGRVPRKKGASQPIILEAAEILIKGPPEKKKEEKRELIPPEMKLTPVERETLKAVEEKIEKVHFQTSIRMMYLGHKDAYFVPIVSIFYGFFNSYSGLNRLGSDGRVATKVQWLFRKKRVYARKKRMFWLYQLRLPSFPASSNYWDIRKGTSILNTEEIASLFHFPSRIVAPVPTMERIEAKKGEPPPGLPTE